MNKMQDRLGTPCHIENCRRKSRDDATAYIPSAPDITAAREKGYGATFSHGKKVEPSKRILKTIAANMIDCPEQKSRAGVYDTITIRDDDGNTYKQMLDFDANSVGEVYNQFRGKYLGTKLYFRGYRYELIKIDKAGYRKGSNKKHKIHSKVKTCTKKVIKKNKKGKLCGFTIIRNKFISPNRLTVISDVRVNIINGKHYLCCNKRLSYKPIEFSYRGDSGKTKITKIMIGECKLCGKHYINQDIYNKYIFNKEIGNICMHLNLNSMTKLLSQTSQLLTR